MTQFTINAQDTERSSQTAELRFVELADQGWERSKSADLAQNEGIVLSDDHWAVIAYLRKHYLEHGLPSNARTLAKTLNQQFSTQGGSKYLHRLFPGGPITQGSRFANLPTPANATDISFGSSY
ncbi:MAG: TusE/DsrC/DsvC family sulfur relay protein [Candidatus Thiodiazotropha sp. (ex. Lucinisca nassula)]|nr:TusE/DsrC/DsvC family sulfur relay protein [Candidatus Thiodiazotropha sp. (ex. Lucinisca nassula)]